MNVTPAVLVLQSYEGIKGGKCPLEGFHEEEGLLSWK